MSEHGTLTAAPLSEVQIAALLKPKRWYQDKDGIRATAIAAISSFLVAVVIWSVLSNSAGWDSVQRSFFSWEHMKDAFPSVWKGFKLNIKIFMIAEPLVLLIGLVLAVIRTTRGSVLFPLRVFAVVYTDFFRGAPALLIIFMLGFGVPGLRLEGVSRDPVLWGTIACILTSSAYTAETFRAGIDSVHISQRQAARSLGLSSIQAFVTVILPQAVRRVVPPLISGFVALQKETSLVSAIGPLEATRRAQIYSGVNFNFSSYIVAAALFIAITIPLARLTDHLLQRAVRERSAGGAT